MKSQFGLTRKILRFGKNIEHLKAAAIAADSKTLEPVLKYLAVGRQLGYFGYLSFDAVTVIDAVGIRKLATAKKLQANAYRAWFAGLVCNVLAGLYMLRKLGEQEKGVKKEDGEGAVEGKKVAAEKRKVRLQLLCDVCDLGVPGSALGYVALDDGMVGLMGTLSSLIGIWTQWKATA